MKCLTVCIELIIVLLACGLPGCKGKGIDTPRIEPNQEGMVGSILDSLTIKKLADHAIVPTNLAFKEPSPDSKFIALALDSTVRFGSGDEMWLDEWPSDWFGIRSRKILYLYDPEADTLSALVECEEIVNLYSTKTAAPVHPERWEYFEAVLWSPDSKRLLLVKDREADGIHNQDALIFTLGQDQPAFLDVFPVWMRLQQTYEGSAGTEAVDVSWIGSSQVKIVFSVVGVEGVPALEVLFDGQTGKVISIKELSST
ncbi:hypothetical protein JXM67_04175 [candidate division WOR-3 bacterium]|nr:hypothetical protein [candidate division WOR-3 bacterium]